MIIIGVALVLVIAIFLCGLLTAFSLLRSQNLPDTAESNAVSFLTSEPSTEATRETESSASAPTGAPSAELELMPSPEGIENIPQEGGLGLQTIYAKNIPSVVSISCESDGKSTSGTGVVLSKDGYLVTNAHVIADAESIRVLLTDGRGFDAHLVGQDTITDLAVLYITATDLTPAEFGDSAKMKVGDAVAAIGDPLGIELRGTMTDGIVSAINRGMNMNGRQITLIQTNAALNSGNSGGPLINCYGQVIGINTMKIGAFSDEAGVEGLGFAIPSVTVKEIVDQLIRQGYVSGRPALPFEGEWVSQFHQQFRRLPAGLYITRVGADTELQAKDILLQVGSTRVTSDEELNAVLSSYDVGDTVSLTLYRNGYQYTTSVRLTEARS